MNRGNRVLSKRVSEPNKKKLGISGPFATMVIVLLGIVAAIVAWQIIQGILKNSETDIAFAQSNVQAKISAVLINESNHSISVTVKRPAGSGMMGGLRFVFSDGSVTETIWSATSIEELGQQIFTFSLDNQMNLSNLQTVSVVPILKIPSGEERLSNRQEIKEVVYEEYWDEDYDLTEEQLLAGFTGTLALHKKFRFPMEERNESVKLDALNFTSAEVMVSSRPPTRAVFVETQTQQFELTRDNYYDINLTLNRILVSNGTASRASFTIKKVHEAM